MVMDFRFTIYYNIVNLHNLSKGKLKWPQFVKLNR